MEPAGAVLRDRPRTLSEDLSEVDRLAEELKDSDVWELADLVGSLAGGRDRG